MLIWYIYLFKVVIYSNRKEVKISNRKSKKEEFVKMQEQQEKNGILSAIYYSANDIAQMLGISKSGAYSIIRKLNSELESRGFIVIQGKVSKAYFEEKWYGLNA